MKIAFIAATALAVSSAPASSAEGHSGYFKIRVTEGSYTLLDHVAGEYVQYSLVGQTATMRWNSSVLYNVPSPYNPAMTVDRLVVNSASINTAGFPFESVSTNDPFQDGFLLIVNANYVGNADAGSFLVYHECNACSDHAISFNFTEGLTGARGFGTASQADDPHFNFVGQIKFEITGGHAFATVPEPASWAIMLGGFGFVGGALRRHRVAPVTFG